MKIDFPEATNVHRRIPKEAFYKRLQLSTALKDRFISDVDHIFVENSLTADMGDTPILPEHTDLYDIERIIMRKNKESNR